VTLSKMVNTLGYGTLTDHLDRLCRYFECSLSELAEYVPDAQSPPPGNSEVRNSKVK
jgi:DNA-binding Xre family transcriptional regulator